MLDVTKLSKYEMSVLSQLTYLKENDIMYYDGKFKAHKTKLIKILKFSRTWYYKKIKSLCDKGLISVNLKTDEVQFFLTDKEKELLCKYYENILENKGE